MPITPEDLAALTVDLDTSIYDAAQVLNGTHRRLVLVVDAERRLQGLVADPDIRRAVLARRDLNQPVSEIMVREPVVAAAGDSPEAILELMERTHIHQIPLLDGDGRVCDVAFIEELLAYRRTQVKRTAVIMAGGFGKRLLPLTEDVPKPLLPVGGRPIIFTILDQLLDEGFNDIIVSVNYRKEQIVESIGAVPRFARVVRYLEEGEPLGTAGALSLLDPRPSGPFVVVNGDVLTKTPFSEMVRFHRHEQNLVTVGLREQRSRVPYGVATLDGTRVVALVEKPEYVHHVNAGIYVLDPAALDYIPRDRVCDMTTAIRDIITAHKRVGCYPIHEYWMDIGQHPQLEKARQEYDAVFGDCPSERSDA